MMDGISAFDREVCRECGLCLQGCPVLRLEAEPAKDCIRRLAGGEYVTEVLDFCTGCMSCDAVCPEGARPYALLLERYAERYVRNGIPSVFMGAMPQRDGPNLWRGLDKWLSGKERRSLELWANPPGGTREVLFLGCNQRLTPYIADTSLFSCVTIFSDPGECCGDYYLRLGLIEAARSKALSLAGRFTEMGIERIIAFCPACENTMTNLAPSLLGVPFDFEIVGLVEWLASRVESGGVRLKNRLRGIASIQDPCHASGLDPSSADGVRRLVELTGLEVREFATSGATAECCGLGASLARYRLTDVLRTGLRRMEQSRRTGADLTCAWCNGCYMVMNMFRLVHPLAPPVFHLLELLQIASGELPVRRIPARPIELLLAATDATLRDGVRFKPAFIGTKRGIVG
jgi:Fe-S oxidoreductase